MQRQILLGLVMMSSLAACSAPQGKKIAMTDGGLPPVATGPSGSSSALLENPTGRGEQISNVTLANQDSIVGVYTTKTFTVTLPSFNRDGYEWRFSEVPDPTVLKLISKEAIPGPDFRTPGEQKLTFEATGVGDVPVKLWYGTLWASPMEQAKAFHITVSVDDAPKPEPMKKAKSKKHSAKPKPVEA